MARDWILVKERCPTHLYDDQYVVVRHRRKKILYYHETLGKFVDDDTVHSREPHYIVPDQLEAHIQRWIDEVDRTHQRKEAGEAVITRLSRQPGAENEV